MAAYCRTLQNLFSKKWPSEKHLTGKTSGVDTPLAASYLSSEKEKLFYRVRHREDFFSCGKTLLLALQKHLWLALEITIYDYVKFVKKEGIWTCLCSLEDVSSKWLLRWLMTGGQCGFLLRITVGGVNLPVVSLESVKNPALTCN